MVKIRTPENQTIVVKPHVQALANALESEFGVTNFGTYLGHSPPEGPTQALDIFTPDNVVGHGLQDKICTYIRNNVKRFGGRYHIRRHQIWNVERETEGYRDQVVTGNRTTDHMDHVHDTQYAFAPGPFGPDEPIPQKPTTAKGEDMLIFNVEGVGIFLSKGHKVVHLQHPDHVFEFVRIGVPYQDKVALSPSVANLYLGIYAEDHVYEIRGDLMETGIHVSYEEQLLQVRDGLEAIKEEYYAMMTGGE